MKVFILFSISFILVGCHSVPYTKFNKINSYKNYVSAPYELKNHNLSDRNAGQAIYDQAYSDGYRKAQYDYSADGEGTMLPDHKYKEPIIMYKYNKKELRGAGIKTPNGPEPIYIDPVEWSRYVGGPLGAPSVVKKDSNNESFTLKGELQ